MDSSRLSTEDLLERAERGDASAAQKLFAQHRGQLKRMVSTRIDPRLAARVDASDVVQDALVEAARRFDEYLQKREVAFYPWLRHLAYERLIQLHRHHTRQKRSVYREVGDAMQVSDDSIADLVHRLIASDTSPSGRAARRETLELARETLARMPGAYREVLLLRHLEQLSVAEAAAVLGVSEGTVKSRHFRAVSQLHERLADEPSS